MECVFFFAQMTFMSTKFQILFIISFLIWIYLNLKLVWSSLSLNNEHRAKQFLTTFYLRLCNWMYAWKQSVKLMTILHMEFQTIVFGCIDVGLTTTFFGSLIDFLGVSRSSYIRVNYLLIAFFRKLILQSTIDCTWKSFCDNIASKMQTLNDLDLRSTELL